MIGSILSVIGKTPKNLRSGVVYIINSLFLALHPAVSVIQPDTLPHGYLNFTDGQNVAYISTPRIFRGMQRVHEQCFEMTRYIVLPWVWILNSKRPSTLNG